MQSVEQYLSQLKKELAGCDRATIQDALADAEEHLMMALAGAAGDDAAVAAILEEYGAPAEVAEAYRKLERPVLPVLAVEVTPEDIEEIMPRDERPWLLRFFGVFADHRTWGAFFYLLFSLATGVIYFTWAITGISLSAGLIILIIGLPFAAAFIVSVRGIGLIEGRIVEALLGVRMPRRPLFYRRGMPWRQRFKLMMADKHTWMSLLYMVLHLPLGVFYFTLMIVLVAVSLALIVLPFFQIGASVPIGYADGVIYYLAGWAIPLLIIIGILLATATMHLARYLGRQQGRLAKAMLVRS